VVQTQIQWKIRVFRLLNLVIDQNFYVGNFAPKLIGVSLTLQAEKRYTFDVMWASTSTNLEVFEDFKIPVEVSKLRIISQVFAKGV